MSRLFDTIAALAIGAGYTYISDPAHGAERRALLRQSVRQRTGQWVRDAAEPVTRDEWSDEMRWAVGSLGAVLFLAGSRRKGSVLTQVAGAALIARAATNRPILSLWQAAESSLAESEPGETPEPSPSSQPSGAPTV